MSGEFLGDLLGGIGQACNFDPETKVIDSIGNGLHLPKGVTDIAKIGIGFFTCDYFAVAGGAADLLGSAMKQPAHTEYPCNGQASPCGGYAPAAATPAGAGPVASYTPGAGTYVPPPPAGGGQVFNVVVGVGVTVGGGPYVPPPPSGTRSSYGVPPPAAPPSVEPCQISGQSALDPNIGEYQRSLEILQANFDTFANAKPTCGDGRPGDQGFITRDKLAAIARDPAASPQLHEASRFLLDHPEYFNRLDVAGGIGGHDGKIGHCDVDGDVKKVKTEIGQYGNQVLPPTSGSGQPGVAGGGSGSVSVQATASFSNGYGGFGSFLNNPGMDIDTKIQMILAGAEQNMDGAIDDVANQIASQSNQLAGINGTDQKSQNQRQQMQTSMQQLQMRLQDLMQRRSELFQLQSNLMDKRHQDGMVAINNLKS